MVRAVGIGPTAYGLRDPITGPCPPEFALLSPFRFRWLPSFRWLCYQRCYQGAPACIFLDLLELWQISENAGARKRCACSIRRSSEPSPGKRSRSCLRRRRRRASGRRWRRSVALFVDDAHGTPVEPETVDVGKRLCLSYRGGRIILLRAAHTVVVAGTEKALRRAATSPTCARRSRRRSACS